MHYLVNKCWRTPMTESLLDSPETRAA